MNEKVTTDGSLDDARATAMGEMQLTGETDWFVQMIPIKCLNCSLHYTVWSENPDWVEEHDSGGYCPECGVWGGNKLVWQEARPGFIFQNHQGGIETPGRLLPGAAPAFGVGGVHAELEDM
jgi:hypothetical protein